MLLKNASLVYQLAKTVISAILFVLLAKMAFI